MFKDGDRVVFTQRVIDKMKENEGKSTKIFVDDCTLTDVMYKDAIGEEYLVFSKVDGKFSKIENLKRGRLNWDERWFELYEDVLKGAEDF